MNHIDGMDLKTKLELEVLDNMKEDEDDASEDEYNYIDTLAQGQTMDEAKNKIKELHDQKFKDGKEALME